MRSLAGIESLLVYFLVPFLIAGIWLVIRQRRPECLLVFLFAASLAVSMSLVVANLGTLFRLRLQFLLPLLLIGAAADPWAFYGRLFQKVKRWGNQFQVAAGGSANGSVAPQREPPMPERAVTYRDGVPQETGRIGPAV